MCNILDILAKNKKTKNNQLEHSRKKNYILSIIKEEKDQLIKENTNLKDESDK